MGCGASTSVAVADANPNSGKNGSSNNNTAANGQQTQNRSAAAGGAAGATNVAPGDMFGRCLEKYLGEYGGAIATGDGERGALVMFVPVRGSGPDDASRAAASAAAVAASSMVPHFTVSYVSKRTGALFALERLGETELTRLKKAASPALEQVPWALFVKSLAADVIKSKVRCDVRGDGAALLHFSILTSKTSEASTPFTLRLPELATSLESGFGRGQHQSLFTEPSIRVVAFRRGTTERKEKERKLDEIARTVANSPHFQHILQQSVGPRTAAVLKVRLQADTVARAMLPDKIRVRSMQRKVDVDVRGNARAMCDLDAMYERGGVFPTHSLHLIRSTEHSPNVVVPSSKLVEAIKKAASMFVAQATEKGEALMPAWEIKQTSTTTAAAATTTTATTCNNTNSGHKGSSSSAGPSHTWQHVITTLSSSSSSSAASASTQQQEERIAASVLHAFLHLDEWSFDIFELEAASGNNALFCVTVALVLKLNLVKQLGINFERFVTFMAHIQAGYHPNPYHNATHAADVTHVLYYILSRGGLAERLKLAPRDHFACLLAASIHDYDHPGFNNSFHIRTNAYLATLYNDRSILENHHLACSFEMMRHPSLNFFAGVKDNDRKAIRDTMCEMVLSTDMGRHQTIFDAFRTKLGETCNWSSGDDSDAKALALSMAIKMADVSNTTRPRNLYIPWVQNLAQEFYHQGDHELLLGMPISPFMDRIKHPDLSRGQISFINFVILPMFEATSQFLPGMRFTTDIARANREYWQSMQVVQA